MTELTNDQAPQAPQAQLAPPAIGTWRVPASISPAVQEQPERCAAAMLAAAGPVIAAFMQRYGDWAYLDAEAVYDDRGWIVAVDLAPVGLGAGVLPVDLSMLGL